MNRPSLLRRLVLSSILFVLIVALFPLQRQSLLGSMVRQKVAVAAIPLRTWYVGTRARATARHQVEQAWRRVQTAGQYRYTADVTQHLVPLATLTNVGRTSKQQRLYLEGEVNLPGRAMQMVVWSQG